jgi:hypothetical protein
LTSFPFNDLIFHVPNLISLSLRCLLCKICPGFPNLLLAPVWGISLTGHPVESLTASGPSWFLSGLTPIARFTRF